MSHSNNSENHIKEQIKKDIMVNEHFAGYTDTNNQSEFRKLAKQFIDATTYQESKRFAKEFIVFVLSQNGKGNFAPSIELFDHTEMNGKYPFDKQRSHYIHQVNVYLLGLFLYHKSQMIQDNIDQEMESTTPKIEYAQNGFSYEYQYSGGSKFSEFLYRWKLASLPHDIGYGISLFENNEKEMINFLQKFGVTDIRNLNDLWLFEDRDLLLQLDSEIPGISIIKYMNEQYKKPLYDSVFYDHGLIGSLIFLRCMNQKYANHRGNIITHNGSAKIIWDERILSGSILQVAIAIAHHNLDQYSKQLESNADDIKIFDLDNRPLSWLLKVSDIIQEWDKPKANENTQYEKTEDSSIHISFLDDKIIVKNIPKNELEKVQQTISDYTNPSNLIEIGT